MTKRLPAIRPTEVVRALELAGWQMHRQRGSHLIMHKPGSRNLVVVPMHNRDLPGGTLRGIITDAGLTTDEFIELLKR